MTEALTWNGKTSEEIIARAEREGAMLYVEYQGGLWYTPEEIRQERATGTARWGPRHLQVRAREEYARKCEHEADILERRAREIQSRATAARAKCKPFPAPSESQPAASDENDDTDGRRGGECEVKG